VEPHLVAVDWGTSSFRAYLLDAHGAVEDAVTADLGILRVSGGDFGRALEAQVGPWLRRLPDAEVLLAGMIGSRQGWAEAPYVPCPAGLDELASGLARVTTPTGREAWIVPGVCHNGSDGVPDVMRGEETQLVGAMGDADAGRRVFVLPGTHSKWAVVEDGRIESFATHMTGELFAVLGEHSILGALMEPGDDPDAFAQGLERAAAPGGLSHHLFGVRALGLFGALSATGARSYLSGLLIGHEVLAARETALSAPSVGVIGGSDLARRYRDALTATGVEAALVSPDVAARGLHRVALARAAERAST
jgi:2-dehydro-3-deoxygalactonokinase